MDMSEFTGSQFVKVDDVRDRPIRARIVGITKGKWNKPDILLSDGSKLSANATNCRTLLRAYGKKDAGWIGQEIELFLGQKEINGESKEMVTVRPISPATAKANGNDDDLDDEITI